MLSVKQGQGIYLGFFSKDCHSFSIKKSYLNYYFGKEENELDLSIYCSCLLSYEGSLMKALLNAERWLSYSDGLFWDYEEENYSLEDPIDSFKSLAFANDINIDGIDEDSVAHIVLIKTN